jgi:cytochrome c biogenesis protein CcdA
MLEDLISAFVRSQFGDVRRRTTGAVLEAGALGMIGLAVVFLSVGLFLWLATVLEAWQAALIVAAVILLLAAVLMLVGRSLLRRRARQRRNDMASGLEALSALLPQGRADRQGKSDKDDPGVAIVGAALAAGLLLGRSASAERDCRVVPFPSPV